MADSGQERASKVKAPARKSALTGAEHDRLAADLRKKYDAGQSIRALAAASGRSYGFVHRILSESGAVIRGGSRKKSGGAATARYDDLVRRGVVVAAEVPKGRAALPDPVRVRGGLSDLVIAERA